MSLQLINHAAYIIQAANNLVVLAKDEAGANKIMQENGVEKLIQMAVEKDTELVQTAVRALACLAEKNRSRVSPWNEECSQIYGSNI